MIFMMEKGKSFDFIADICLIVTSTMFIHPVLLIFVLLKERNKRVQPEIQLDNVQ